MIKSMYSPCFTHFSLIWKAKYPDVPLEVEKGGSHDVVSILLDKLTPEQVKELDNLIDFYDHAWKCSYGWYAMMIKQYIEVEYTKEIVLLANGN